MHRRAVSITRDDGDQLGEVALVIGEISVDPADGEGEAANLGAPDCVFGCLVLTAAVQRSVSVAAGEQQCAQTIDRLSLGL